MGKTKYKSSSIERSVQGYLKHRVYMMFMADKMNMLRGNSEHLNCVLTKYYESLTLVHQQNLLDDYKFHENKKKNEK